MCGRGLHYYQLNRRDRRSVFHTHFIDKGGSLYKINMYRHYVGIEEVNWFGQVARPCIDRINEPIKSPQTCMYIIGGGFWNDIALAKLKIHKGEGADIAPSLIEGAKSRVYERSSLGP